MTTAADAAPTPAALPCQRELFELPDDLAYLNCAYMAPQLREVTAAGVAAVRRKAAPWTLAPADFFDDLEAARDLVARLVGGDADGVAVVPSASYGLSLAAGNLPVAAGEAVVILAEQYPSNVYVWRDAVARAGGRLVTVARPSDGDWTPAVLAAVDEATAVVAVPNCHWTDGGLLDLE
ncbi:MAG: aminotransferase class V-fold PLP-dependent enzyme, partial [Actinomycetota bacterium]|nr:aminotransferase class V-fold PLP-dependent enzyme [Actinomycetota bacterium]